MLDLVYIEYEGCGCCVWTGRRLVLDLVPNQTSRNHTWFKSSQKKEDKYAAYYVWSDTNPGWVSQVGIIVFSVLLLGRFHSVHILTSHFQIKFRGNSPCD